MFRIGAFARLAGVSARMLRAWDALGLFRPVWVDPSSGYRWYSAAQLPELRRILSLRDVGVPLVEVAQLVSGGVDLRAVLARRREALERDRRETERRLHALDITVEMADDGLGRPAVDVVVRPLASELVAALAVESPTPDIGAAFYELESVVRDAGRRAARPPGAIVATAGGRGLRLAEIFVPLSAPFAPTERIRVTRLPACRAASVIHRGSYDGVPTARRTLERWVAAAGLAAAGSLRILYLQFGAEPELRVPPGYLVTRDADFVTELQLPVN